MTCGDEEKIRRFSSLERSPERVNLSGRKIRSPSLSTYALLEDTSTEFIRPRDGHQFQKSTSGLGDFIIEFADGDLGGKTPSATSS
ncbi:unnamed protein product [Linum tenue]|uniref:Uncharacterized protein n=1 Tax=Linum tenue TaxID=586396 RepID=A0AAV0HZV4_9ROSI|nr:unnamed protein product [Linum tenue]